MTLANWRQAPWNRWSFRHVDEILPVARIAADVSGVKPLARSPEPLGNFAFTGPDGREWILEEMLRATMTSGFVVLRRGAIVYEWYDQGFDAQTPHIVFSVSKSITGLLAGNLVACGQLEPDAPVTRYIPEAIGSAYGDCTVRHILDMTVSIDFAEQYLDASGPFARYRIATGWNPVPDPSLDIGLHQFLVTLPRDHWPHGERFFYASPNSDLLGWILERAGQKPYFDLLSEEIWRPMGAEHDAYVTIDKMGAARSAGGICITSHDAARLGEIVRCGGVKGEERVLSPDWLADLRDNGDRSAWLRSDMQKLLPNGRYRSQWYLIGNDHGAYCAIGIHGQWIYVDPMAECVFVKFSAQALPIEDDTDRLILRCFEAIGDLFLSAPS